ncbi:MAG: pyridoxamine 5'-phosphate oxidase family protein [Methanomicrobia archaeon]|nr:pyridoxamine 5'-phosphate oxidase family protein [Methanomicrobia archaeon]
MTQAEKSKIVEIMKKNYFGAHLATCDSSQPRVRPVAPIVEPDLSLWVATHCSSRKVQEITANPRIALSFVEHPGGAKVAIVTGEAEPIDDLDQKKRVWKIAPLDLSRFFPEGHGSAEFCLFKIRIEKIEWRESWESKTKVYTPS